jgi:AcrR family transcriptional regulator
LARRRFEDLPSERRAEILRLAAAEFARTGFQGTSYNQLLERLQLGKSSAYYYFDDKRDLFLTVIEHCYAGFFEAIAALPRPRTADEFWRFVQECSLEGFELMLRDPTIAGLMQCLEREQTLLGELASERVLNGQARFYESMITEGQRLGAVRTDLPTAVLAEAARSLSLTFDRWFVREHNQPGFAGTATFAAQYSELVRRVCEPPSAVA